MMVILVIFLNETSRKADLFQTGTRSSAMTYRADHDPSRRDPSRRAPGGPCAGN
jgi:hypothetical protein